jgi:hypothetical protein
MQVTRQSHGLIAIGHNQSRKVTAVVDKTQKAKIPVKLTAVKQLFELFCITVV